MREGPYYRKFRFHFLLYSIFLFLLLEILLRLPYFPSVQFRLEDKKLHCLVETSGNLFSIPWMRLCPNQNLDLFHPEKNIRYHVSTDIRGERLTSAVSIDDARSNAESTGRSSYKTDAPEIWILGDSVALGYLVSDQESLPWALQNELINDKKTEIVRNLGVDALGSFGIQERLEEVLKTSPPPKVAYWIYHISDFTDSYRELALQNSGTKKTLVRISYFLSKYSAIFNACKIVYEKYKPESGENLVIPSSGSVLGPDHPHRKAAISFFEFTKEKKIPLVLVFLPEPNEKYEPVVDSALVKEVRQIAIDSKIPVLDLQQSIYDYWKKNNQEIFLPKDGHPNPALYRFIASEIKKDIH
ncbi:SGNH/GDSL hydrolase family protein [Leptospira sp. WS58.C1]|uniref:LA_2486 family SGNH/GDSL-type esterase n=1 Tax=Leptospira TaxID=171 RepID=UPI0002BEA2D3|nr:MULTISPECIES: SGNH/GDSL hydrolase family protein [unclassified Leptospira]EMJ97010.1 GDSL-like lipase/acylhydrolase family protein [Leptospira sp. B5-022]MCR1792562.1 SGNH/GDSL hydrolase family protein [Leptospira sp. id769339]